MEADEQQLKIANTPLAICFRLPVQLFLLTMGLMQCTLAGEAESSAGELVLKKSISQYGITWTFSESVQVGQFVNGDYYVVGPVVVQQIDPKPRFGAEVPDDELDLNEMKMIATGSLRKADRVRNGSMVNPPARGEVGFDSGIREYFRGDLAAHLPIALKPGDCLASSISLRLNEVAKTPYTGMRHPVGQKRGYFDSSPVRTAAILTCVATPQPADAFRPAYCDREGKIYLARDLRRNLLGNLPRPDACCLDAGASLGNHRPEDPPCPENLPRIEDWIRVFKRPWINTGFFGFEVPMENMPHYEQWIGQAMSVAGLILMLDYPAHEKEELLIGLVQVGIDYWGAIKNGHPGWQGWGGHGSGRKFPIVFSGLMLGDPEMAAPTKSFPKALFGEDNQTMYGPCWTGAGVCFAGHSGVHPDGSVPRPKWGPYEHMHPAEWKNEGAVMNMQSEAYRRANSSSSWVGQALVIRMLEAEEQWNHDAFFDYVDRWMFEDDSLFRKEIAKAWPSEGFSGLSLMKKEGENWAHQGQAWEPFVTDLWFKYRPTLKQPIDKWKKTNNN